jgi:hypothetical protein
MSNNNRRVSNKRRLSLTNDDSDKRQRSEDSHMSIGRSAIPSRGDGATTPPAASSASSSLEQELGPNEPGSARQGYASASASPTSSDDGDSSRPAPRPSTSAPRAPTWQTDAPAADQRQWSREQKPSIRAREETRDDRNRDHLDPRGPMPSRPSGSTHHDERRSPSGGAYANQLVQPPPKTQAAFVGKLYSMLEDDKIRRSGLLHWSQDGSSFVCPNPTEFSK